MLYVFSLLAFLVCAIAFVNGLTRITASNYKAVNFAKEIKGKKLVGNVIREIEVASEGSCRLECVEENRCLSYNFGPTENKHRYKCQLSDSDRFLGLNNFTGADNQVLYRGIQSVCEKVNTYCGDNEVCIPSYKDNSAKCKCIDGYSGTPCSRVTNSCAQLLEDGITTSRITSGVYTINPGGGKPIQVFCDMTTDGGGWTVFQRRVDGSVDFYRDWNSYKYGFGDLNGEFWLGNDNLHRLTADKKVILRVDLEDFEGNITYAEYKTFEVESEGDRYLLSIKGYSGTAGDSMAPMAGNQKFTTKDNDNDINGRNCAEVYKGAWWYSSCHGSNLNGLYHGGPYQSFADGVCWVTFRGLQYSLKRTEMKVKPKT